jgi:hypothetical protein
MAVRQRKDGRWIVYYRDPEGKKSLDDYFGRNPEAKRKAILNWSVKPRPPLIPFNPVRDYQGPSKKDEIILPPPQDEIERLYKKSLVHLPKVR